MADGSLRLGGSDLGGSDLGTAVVRADSSWLKMRHFAYGQVHGRYDGSAEVDFTVPYKALTRRALCMWGILSARWLVYYHDGSRGDDGLQPCNA